MEIFLYTVTLESFTKKKWLHLCWPIFRFRESFVCMHFDLKICIYLYKRLSIRFVFIRLQDSSWWFLLNFLRKFVQANTSLQTSVILSYSLSSIYRQPGQVAMYLHVMKVTAVIYRRFKSFLSPYIYIDETEMWFAPVPAGTGWMDVGLLEL